VAAGRNGNGRETLVVVGNGMVGHRFCEAVHDADAARRFDVVCLGEEPRPAYDRVHLSEYFSGRTAEALALADRGWYAERGIGLHVGERVVAIDRERGEVVAAGGQRIRYDTLVLATGSAPFVPPLPGIERPGVFVYRTIEDLEAIEAWGRRVRSAAVIGGGLLGLEAAKAARDMGLETHVVEFAPRLMPRQLDAGGGAMLRRAIEGLGVRIMVDARTTEVLGAPAVSGLRFETGDELPVEMVIVSAGIRPRDELARAAGLEVGSRGGVVVDDRLRTSDPRIHAIGEVALHGGTIYGLVGPGYEMAAVLAANLTGGDRRFTGADVSTRLKLLGVDVASVGDPFAGGGDAPAVVFEDRQAGVYQKLVLSADGRRLAGGILVGDVGAYGPLLAKVREGSEVPDAAALLLGGTGAGANGASDGEKVCSCNDVSRGAIRAAIAGRGLTTVGGVKACTRAGTGCGGCLATVEQILACELVRTGRAVDRTLCEHFAYTRQELFQIAKIRRLRTFAELIRATGRGDGCEICKPAAASIFASTWNDPVLDQPTIQDTNDRFLANIQRGGTYSVIPRIPGGEVTPEQLIVLGQVAKRYDLYCKITGGQRIDLLGARVDQLPDIWEELVAAGFESGHAYGKALRTVKSCVGTTWCRYGVQDSTGFAIRLEERYRGIRSPHKVKAAVSGCIRECAEAQGKDFGLIATEKGWNLYVGGNGGSNPRHADLLASDIDEETVVRYVDRFLMYYIHTADRLQRTARWIEAMDGGIEYLKSVVIDDSLGICAELERDMAALVASYECEWAAVVRDPVRRAAFRHYVNSTEPDETLEFVRERGQRRPADWPAPVTAGELAAAETSARAPGEEWVRLATVDDVPRDGGAAARYGDTQIALFNFASRGEWYATQNVCPHRRDMVLARGILGDQQGIPKVACPVHKKTFSLLTGAGLSDGSFRIRTFPVEIRGEEVWVRLPPAAFLERTLPRRSAPEAESPCATCARAC
jgi:nitrite reductase (NADH) large subunit